ncbi:protein kinase [Streptomyces sp. NPDC059524]|uniref:protein kinase n=1 Tax=Streptomyces sp. NPDC059524 TaxID=3346856 RepID=UPI0036CA4FC7
MEEYAGRVLADRYRLPLRAFDDDGFGDAAVYAPHDATRAFDTYSGQEVLVRQVPLPEVVEAEVLDADGLPDGFRPGAPVRASAEPSVARAIEAAQAAAQIPDHPRLDQVFDVFAEGGSLWIVSEAVAARPLAALLDAGPLSPYRAAEVASDVLTALRALHAHGWVHRNVTARTVMICDDGRVLLTGLAAGAAEEALCGYDPRPETALDDEESEPEPEPAPVAPPSAEPDAGDYRAARAGAIAAYRAGARAAASGGRIDDPYGVREGWHGAAPRAGVAGVPVQPARWNELIPRDGAADQELRPEPRASSPAQAENGSPVLGAVAAERARQVRMTVVGPVTERWAPEQAHPVQDSWQLAAPVGPATDLWALGALLFRAVQGHAPYPEESTPELVQMVCAEPPAFAEECGPLRPVVESLLRQDPTERLDIEELRGWLRSLVRSAPEPEAGTNVVPAPAFDAARLPVVRRRGELVRRRRRSKAGAAHPHARHKRAPREREREPQPPRRSPQPRRAPQPRQGGGERRPASLGRWLLVLILLGLVGAVAYAMVFMPEAGSSAGPPREQAGVVGGAPDKNGDTDPKADPSGPAKTPKGQTPKGKSPSKKETSDPSSTEPQSDVAAGFSLRKDPEGFQVAVAKGWQRQAKNGRGQILYTHGNFALLVVPGRDSTTTYGTDPMKYQREDERELQPFRDSSWATSSGMKTIEVGGRTMAEGQFTWQESGGEVFVRNVVMVIGGKFHIVQVRGPEAERDEVSRLFEQASATYRYGG